MTLPELAAYLEAERYQPLCYHIGSGWAACADAYCLEQVGSRFEMFYVERGQRTDTIRCFEAESEACSAFIRRLDQERFSRAHCVGSFPDQVAADLLADKLTVAGITVHRDTIVHGGPADLRHRVFVFGRDKLRASELLRKVSCVDSENHRS